jgi:hypothetical protein
MALAGRGGPARRLPLRRSRLAIAVSDVTMRSCCVAYRGGVISRRSGVWLTTVSTVVAVATGMFTLRDQIFPADAGHAEASRGAYEQSIGQVCDAANEAERERERNAARLAKRLKRARTTLDQRNAVLDSTNEILVSSQHRLASFKGLDAPSVLKTREGDTSAAWGRMVARLEVYAQRLDAVTNRRDLLAVVETLPSMRTGLGRDSVTRDAGLTQLGGGHCELDAPTVTPTITLRDLRQPVTSHARSPLSVNRRASSDVPPAVEPPVSGAADPGDSNVRPAVDGLPHAKPPPPRPRPAPSVRPPQGSGGSGSGG